MSAHVPFRADKEFGGTVEERVKQLVFMRLSLQLRYLVGRPLVEQIAALVEMRPLLEEVLPELLQLHLRTS